MKEWFKKNWIVVLLVGVMIIGMGLIAYPTFSDWWNSFHQSRAVASYVETVANMDTKDFERYLKEAEAYNRELAEHGMIWQMTPEQEERYRSILNVSDTGIMGYIDIPKISVTLPIYHGTDEDVLQVAIGHIEGSSFPVGGAGTHALVSGHRGLPSARLFTDLDKMVVGDTWTMNVLNRTVTYEVDQIRIVLPNDLSDLQIQEGKDYCTLITCTPYGINTHRLLVRGHRIDNAQGDAQVIADALVVEPIYIAPFIAAPILVILFIWMLVSTNARKRHREHAARVQKELELRFGAEEGHHEDE